MVEGGKREGGSPVGVCGVGKKPGAAPGGKTPPKMLRGERGGWGGGPLGHSNKPQKRQTQEGENGYKTRRSGGRNNRGGKKQGVPGTKGETCGIYKKARGGVGGVDGGVPGREERGKMGRGGEGGES